MEREAQKLVTGVPLAHPRLMSDHKAAADETPVIEEQDSTEEQNVKIDAIVGDEVLGYDGSGRGEHSGQTEAPEPERITDPLANNRPDQVIP